MEGKSDPTVQEDVDGANKNEPEDEESPSEGDCVRAGIVLERQGVICSIVAGGV
jgi:hypothetical protein